MTYNVFGGTLSPTQSVNQSVPFLVDEQLRPETETRQHLTR